MPAPERILSQTGGHRGESDAPEAVRADPERPAGSLVVLCRRLAARSPGFVGSPWSSLGALALAALWVATGPIFHWSGNWLLVPAALTSVLACLLLFLLQYSQNRDTRAIQLELDEIEQGFQRVVGERTR